MFAVCTNINITAKAQVNVQDSFALVDLYNSTQGTRWKHLSNWLTGPVKTWYGVVVSSGRVTKINLSDNKLKSKQNIF